MKKKYYMVFLLAGAMLIQLAGCGAKASPAAEQTAASEAQDKGQSTSDEALVKAADTVFRSAADFDQEVLRSLPIEDDEAMLSIFGEGDAKLEDTKSGQVLADYWRDCAGKLIWTVAETDTENKTATVSCKYVNSDEFYKAFVNYSNTLEVKDGTDQDTFEALCEEKAIADITEEKYNETSVEIQFDGDEKSGYTPAAISGAFIDVIFAGLITAEDAWMADMVELEESDEGKELEAIADILDCQVLECPGGLVIAITNPEDREKVQADINVQFYDEKGDPTWMNYAELNYLPKGEKLYAAIEMEDGYSSYDLEIRTGEGYMEDISGDMELGSAADEGDFLLVNVKNTGKQTASTAVVTVLYYNKEGALVGYGNGWAFDLAAGTTEGISTGFPYDCRTKEALEYDHYEIYVRAYVQD